jgi:hypothetical protein
MRISSKTKKKISPAIYVLGANIKREKTGPIPFFTRKT